MIFLLFNKGIQCLSKP